MRMPTVNFLVQCAQMSIDSDMRNIVRERCSSCRIILSSGKKFKMIKVAFRAFCKLMPPVCRTCLSTENGEPGPDAVDFDPATKGFKGTDCDEEELGPSETLSTEISLASTSSIGAATSESHDQIYNQSGGAEEVNTELPDVSYEQIYNQSEGAEEVTTELPDVASSRNIELPDRTEL